MHHPARGPAVVAALALLLAAGAAAAHWRGGGGVVWAPAYPYHGPYYAPPPPATEGCYAGAWVCPLDRPAAVGEPCACATGQGGAGLVWGRAR